MDTSVYGATIEIKNLAGIVYKYKTHKSSIREKDGTTVHERVLIAPVNWSQTAIDILSQKYFRKNGIPHNLVAVKEDGVYADFYRQEMLENPEVPLEEQMGGENSAHQVFHRLAGCWTYWGIKSGYFSSKKHAMEFYAECYDSLYKQIAAPNSPQFFNTGLHWAYGIKTDISTSPLYHNNIHTGEVEKSIEGYVNPQVHACYINSVEDNMIGTRGIFDLVTREAAVFKYGSGSGTNYSKIRGKNEPLSGGGVSSGLMSFLKINDSSAGAIKSGGTTRRSARMVVVDDNHPEVEDYVMWKVNEENKVAALISGSILNKRLVANIVDAKTDEEYERAIVTAYENNLAAGMLQRAMLAHDQGIKLDLAEFDADWQGDAYATVSGQNSNNSVSISDKFMTALYQDADWDLIARKTGKAMKTIKAKKLWNDIAFAAWASADPGIQYVDTMNKWNTCANDERIRASNPCSEYLWFDDTACNLASLNLVAIYEEAGRNINKFAELLVKYSKIYTAVLDISIQMAQFPSAIVAEKTWKYRTLGLGYGNIGSLLMRLGIAYGDPVSVAMVRYITAIIHGAALLESAKLAEGLGAFPQYSNNVEPFKTVMRQHHSCLTPPNKEQDITENSVLFFKASTIWDEVVNKHKFRNAQVTVIAPMGTIGLLMSCDTTGIEPDFALVKSKKLAGGGYIKLINQAVPEALETLGYSEESIRRIVGHISGFNHFPEFNINEKQVLDYITVDDIINSGVTTEQLESVDTTKHYSLLSVLEELEKVSGVDLSVYKLPGSTHTNTENYIFGHGCVDDCKELQPKHLPVFDCAVPGKLGGRSLGIEPHLVVMAAAQEFISGGISKTINAPYDATVADIANIYEKAYGLGIKAVSIYRDGSKLSQPLMSAVSNYIAELVNRIKQTDEPAVSQETAKQHVMHVVNQGSRRKMPNKRSGYTQKVKVAGHTLYLRTGEYHDGKLGEIFLDMHKQGATFRAFMNSFAVAVSIGLQYGVPLEEFVNSFIKTKFEPAGPVVGHDNIKFTQSLIDLIFRDLAFNYLGRTDLVEVKPKEQPNVVQEVFEGTKATVSFDQDLDKNTITVKHNSKPSVYTGDICSECGSDKVVPSGTCATCSDCGTTTGCA